MERRVYHGNLNPETVAQALIAHLHRGNYAVQQIGHDDEVVVQVATRQRPTSGGHTAIAVSLQKIEDGVSVQVGKQAWLGLAASLGVSALTALRNPMGLLGRLDDIAQDIEHIQLSEAIWEVVEESAQLAGATHQLSERLRRTTCEYCGTANPVGEASCVACGAPMGGAQPVSCLNCGHVTDALAVRCPNCGRSLHPR